MKHSKYCQTFDKILWNRVLQVWKENIIGIKESKIIIIGIKKDRICQGKRLKGNKKTDNSFKKENGKHNKRWIS